MTEEQKNQTNWVDVLDQKLFSAFPGRVVRKDLVKRFKVGDNIPVYVLEYLLGKYCSTTNEKEIEEGIQRVKDVISERIVRADRGELIKSNLKKKGVHKLIDLATVVFDEKDEGGKGRGGRWCKVNLCIWKKSSSAPGKINENESSEFWPEMRKTTALDLDHFRVRNPHPNILIGTASDRYARWIGQIYSEG